MSFHFGLKRGYEETLMLDSFKSYQELDKVIMNFESETEFLNSIDRKDFNEVLISNQNNDFNYISSVARKLIPICENGNVKEYINSITSSMFVGDTKIFDINIFKEYLLEEKLKFTRVNNSFGERRLELINSMLNILDYGEYNDETISLFKSKMYELTDKESYARVRNIFTTLDDFGFLYDESIKDLYKNNELIIDEQIKDYYINLYNRKIDAYFNKKNQMSFEDFTEQIYSEMRNSHPDLLPGDMSFPPNKKLNLRG